MPDENSTQVWVAQTSQNDQAVEEQPVSDFVLDFWDWENIEDRNQIEETDSENLNFDAKWDTNDEIVDEWINFDQDNLFWESKDDKDDDVNLGDININLGNNDVSTENDNFVIDMNLEDSNDSNTEPESTEVKEENIELWDIVKSNDVAQNIKTELISEEVQLENSEDNPFEGVKEENKMESVNVAQEKMSQEIEENESVTDSDHSLDMDADLEWEKNDIKDELQMQNSIVSSTDNNTLEENLEQPIRWDESLSEMQDNQNMIDSEIIPVSEKERKEGTLQSSDESIYSNETLQENGADFKNFSENNTEENFIDEGINNNTLNNDSESMIKDRDFSNDIGEQIVQKYENNEWSDNFLQNTDEEYVDNNLTKNDDMVEEEEVYSSQDDSDPILEQNVVENDNREDLQLTNDFILDEKSISDDESNGFNPMNSEFIPDNESLENDAKFQNEYQEQFSDSENKVIDNTEQPSMTDLLWWKSVDFSYEENALDVQKQETSLNPVQSDPENKQLENIDTPQNPLSEDVNYEDSQNSPIAIENDYPNNVENQNLIQSNWIQGTNEWNSENIQENVVNDLNIDKIEVSWINALNDNVYKIPDVNETKVIDNQIVVNNISEVSENTYSQPEIEPIKSTLSLDEILDSELQSNPELVDSSKSMPNNITTKTTATWSKKMITIFTWIWLMVLAWIVVVLAFPSIIPQIIWERDVEINPIEIEPIVEAKPEEAVVDENKWDSDENPIWIHWTPVEVEFPEDTVDDKTPENTVEDKTEIYEYTELENQEDFTEDWIWIEYIQSKISSFKSQGEWYKEVWESIPNEKVIKYATYVIRLCEDYQSQINSWEWVDSDTFYAFETKVWWFISKIEEQLSLPEEVETVYTLARFDNDDTKAELRAYLEGQE